MTPDTEAERAAIALFERALDLGEEERAAFVEAQTVGRPRVRERLLAMIAATPHPSLRTGGAAESLAPEQAPDRVGAYRIAGLIGRGGMGSVYLGERAVGDFHHVVAIKVIKPGVLSQALVERFRSERRTLAGLSHPNIARLYDGGETEAGSPYIVMEHVDGEPLLAWAAGRELSPKARRELFADICAAVAYAHRNLVIHRDLTPSNVLVTRDGQVKLIDFGISKPADLAEPADGAAASVASLSLTPGYAAPERMTSAKVTTAADIYSLGRLLEKLAPPGPRDVELRAIIEKATRPAPQDRYPTVDALASDVAALDRGAPIRAMGQSRGYMARKFVSRHARALTAAAAVFVCLVGALALTSLAYSRADAARAAEARRFAQLRSVANYLLFDLNDRLERVVGNTEARADLAERAQHYLSSLAASPHTDPQVRYEAALGLIKLARIQGVPNEPNLGQGERAHANLALAERLLGELRAERPAQAGPALAQSQALHSVVFLHADGQPREAGAYLIRAKASLGPAPAFDKADPNASAWFDARRVVRKAELEHADLGDRAKDLPALADALEADIEAWPASMRRSRAEPLDRAYAAYYRALARDISGDPKGAVPLFQASRRRLDGLVTSLPNDPVALYMSAYNALSGFAAASQAGREDVSAAFIGSARSSVDQLLRLDANDASLYALAANIKEGQSQNLRDHDRFAEAVALQREVVENRRRSLAGRPSARAEGNLAFSNAILGVIARDAGDRTLACSSWKAAQAGFTDLQRRKQLVGFFAGFLPGLNVNVQKCDAGASIKAFGPLRS